MGELYDLVTDEKVEKFMTSLREQSFADLERMRQEQLMPNTSVYKNFFWQHVRAYFMSDAHPEEVLGNPELLAAYQKGEMTALGFLSAGNTKKSVVALTGLIAVAREHSQKGMGKQLFLALVCSFARELASRPPAVQIPLISLFEGSPELFQDLHYQAGYSGIIVAAAESQAAIALGKGE